MNAGDRDFFLEEELQASGGTPRQDEGPRIARPPQSDIWQEFDREATEWANGTGSAVFIVTRSSTGVSCHRHKQKPSPALVEDCCHVDRDT